MAGGSEAQLRLQSEYWGPTVFDRENGLYERVLKSYEIEVKGGSQETI